MKAKENEVKQVKALVTSRVLFISVLDKIYLVVLLLMFIGATLANFSGDISSISYGFWGRIGSEILIVLGTGIWYLIFNWFFKCAVKTILCLTDQEVYLEKYYPLRRSETTIPINKITGVTTYQFFWIFRSIIIHQYHRFPIVFFTWNNQEFKDKLEELMTKTSDKVQNEYEDKNIISKDQYKYLKYVGMALAALMVLIGVVRFFAYITSSERKVAGTYTYNSESITLKSNGSCSLGIIDDVKDCSWTYRKDDHEIYVTYTYEYQSYYYGTRTAQSSLYLKYNVDEKTISYQGNTYRK